MSLQDLLWKILLKTPDEMNFCDCAPLSNFHKIVNVCSSTDLWEKFILVIVSTTKSSFWTLKNLKKRNFEFTPIVRIFRIWTINYKTEFKNLPYCNRTKNTFNSHLKQQKLHTSILNFNCKKSILHFDLELPEKWAFCNRIFF